MESQLMLLFGKKIASGRLDFKQRPLAESKRKELAQ
jgi:hypothetical protein